MHYEVETVGPTHYTTWQIIVSETSDAVLGSIGSPALCCTQKRNPLFEIILSTGLTTIYMQKKPRMQQSRPQEKSVRQGLGRNCSTLFIGCYGLLDAPQGQLQELRSSHCHKCGRMRHYTSEKHVFHSRRSSTSLRHGHTRTSDRCFSSQWSFGVLDLPTYIFFAFSSGELVDVSSTGLQQWQKITFTPGSRHRVTTYRHLVCLNDSDSQTSYRPETFNVVTNTHQKAKETREDCRDFRMCENVTGH